MVRLIDIAKKVGVSITTVSYVLGGNGEQRRIPEKTREQIIAEAGKMGYRKNALGVQLKKGRSRQIAFLSDQFTREYVFSIFAGLAEKADKSNYSCRMHHLDPILKAPDKEIRNFYAHILEARPEAIVIHNTLPLAPELVKSCHEMKILICVVENRAFEGADLLVHSDSADGEKQAVDYLLSHGHRTIGFVFGHYQYMDPIRDGFLAGMKSNRLKREPRWVFLPESEKITVNELDDWLSALKGSGCLPTAVCCCSDFQAASLMFTAIRLGLRVPEDISIVGFGGLSFTSAITPKLTTVQKNYVEIGKLAAEKLLALLSGKIIPAVAFTVSCHVQEGSTVATLKAN